MPLYTPDDPVVLSGPEPWILKSANYTAQAGNRLLIDTSNSNVTVTLPSNPQLGQEIEFFFCQTNVVQAFRINLNGSAFNSNADLQILKLGKLLRSVCLVYTGSSLGWLANDSVIVAGIDLNYASLGDSNGLFYYLGTNKGLESWQNPHARGLVTMSASSIDEGSTDTPQNLVSRDGASYATANAPNQHFQADLGSLQRFKLSYYTLQGSWHTRYQLRNWQLQGSKDQSSWDTLDANLNNTSISPNAWAGFAVNSETAYRYFRLKQTGPNAHPDGNNNYFVLNEWEMYGTFIEI